MGCSEEVRTFGHSFQFIMKKLILLSALAAFCACKKSDDVKSADKPTTTETTTAAVDSELSVPESTQQSAEPIKEAEPATSKATTKYVSFGEKINAGNAIASADMLKKYKSMKKGDTLQVKFASVIREVCKKKGCWMSMQLPNGEESFVRFKDYGFFVPKNADNSNAIVSGKAYIDVVSVAELQHYAKDGGKSQEEIDQITEPKITYAFQADGVLIQE